MLPLEIGLNLKANFPKQTFKPAWWCRGPHAQTLFGALPPRVPPFILNRERLETPDGDFLDLDFLAAPSGKKENPPCVVILHGLEGSSKSSYVRRLLGQIQKRGWRAVAINMRMCSGETNRLKQTYHSGKTEDLDLVVDYLGQKEKGEKFYLVGFSIGGNIVLKWLGEKGAGALGKIERAVAVSVPYDLGQSVQLLDRGFNRSVYTRVLLASLRSKALAKIKRFPDAFRYDRVKKCKTFTSFDREVTAPLNGFANETDYWTKSSCRNFLESIRVKTRLIHAADDPFFPARLLPREALANSEYLEALIVPYGGHLGFVSGALPWRPGFWLENQILDFFG